MLLQFHYQRRLLYNPWGFPSPPSLRGHTWIITQPPYSHNFCKSKMAFNNRASLYILARYGNPDVKILGALKIKLNFYRFLDMPSKNTRSIFIFRVSIYL